MVFYDFKCVVCGHVDEINRPMGVTTPDVCTKCGATSTRIYTVPTVVPCEGMYSYNHKS